jgi:signal transduction histidine kinase/CheY-like chemotaxis protein
MNTPNKPIAIIGPGVIGVQTQTVGLNDIALIPILPEPAELEAAYQVAIKAPVRKPFVPVTSCRSVTRKEGNVGASEVAHSINLLREGDRRKDEFLAILSHELRNPLAPLLNASQLIRYANMTHHDREWLADLVQRQVQQMARLVDDLLDVSRVNAGKLALNKQRIDLMSVIDSVVEASRPLVDKRGHVLHVAPPSEPVFIDADPERLTQVFSNLLNNAAKYTDLCGSIWLAVERADTSVLIKVRDTGIGIAADTLPGIFELYVQAEEGSARSRGGLGIGLCVARRLVELHRGQISANSQGPGCGSEFVVRLPLAEVPHEQDASVATEAVMRPEPVPHRRVLIADDDEDAAASLAMLLRMAGHDVEVVHDGAAVLAAVTSARPDVVLLDWLLPNLSGQEVARQLRQQFGCNLRLIAVTGFGLDRYRRESREVGFDHYLVKPVDWSVIERLLIATD